MKRRIQSSILLIGIALFTAGLVTAAPKTDRSKNEINVYGRVLQIDSKQHTLLISDHWSKKLYLVTMPEGARFKIFFGIYKAKDDPSFANVYKNDIVQVRCTGTSKDRLSRLDDGREVVALTASR
jgi:hypothetical protein